MEQILQLPLDEVREINQWAVHTWWPELVILIDVDPAVLDAWLNQGEQTGRALDSLDGTEPATDPASAALQGTPELSLARLTAETSPAVRLLDAVLFDALRAGASDVHIECVAGGAEVRLRRDGVMQAMRHIDGAALAEQIVSRLKVMAELDIGERRLPQDGRFKLKVEGREVDFRLSIMPSVAGEDAVVRVLDRGPQFPDVSGPSVGLERLHGLVRESPLGLPVLGGHLLGKGVRKQGNILPVFGKRRHHEGDDIETEEQVLPEFSLAHHCGKVTVRGGQQTHIS